MMDKFLTSNDSARIRQIKKKISDLIGNPTFELSASDIMPVLATLLRAQSR
jgi:hypothetical protein